MKKLFLVFFILFSTTCFADVTREIVATDIAPDGAIRIYTQWKVDGVEVESRYPKIGGKFVWLTSYSLNKLNNMTKPEARAFIEADLKRHGEKLIRRAFEKVENDNIRTTKLDNIVGNTNSYETAIIIIDKDRDGQPDEEWTVKTDGSKTVKQINPIPVP